ncbi:hypothetical protein BDY24DRAFT_369638 [Mrakia frigida]|uniref:Rba50p n=1 Tax=Mrakia frigida TaxID=29902 RepID=UPI003FCC2698
MSPQEIQQEKEELLERFGGGLLDVLRKRREKREAQEVHTPQPSSSPSPAIPYSSDETSRILSSIQKENDDRFFAMSHEERMSEKQELLDKFGGGLLDVLKKRREAREAVGAAAAGGGGEKKEGDAVENREPSASASKTPRVRFAPSVEEVPPPPALASSSEKPFTFPFSPVPQPPTTTPNADEEEDTPESIRSRYFSTDTSFSPSKLEWMQPSSSSSPPAPSPALNEIRYSLEGLPISSDLSETLPTHLGLHHHGDSPSHAGYTLAEVVHLSLSTSPAQRSGMLGVLAKIVRNDDGREKGLRGKAMEVAGRAVDERGGGMMVVVRGIEVVYEVLVGGRQRRGEEGWELGMEIVGDRRSSAPNDEDDEEDILSTLHLPSLIPILLTHLAAPSFPSSTTHSLLSLLLLFSLLPLPQSSLLLAPTNPSPLLPTLSRNLLTLSPDPTNLYLLNSLIASSRSTALEILNSPVSPLPALLKYVAAIMPTGKGRELAKGALEVYRSLARYGLSSSLCSDASEVWRGLGREVGRWISASSKKEEEEEGLVKLATSYYRLLTTWTVCAIDPHKTTPEHEITWSQIVGMGWGEDGVEALGKMLSVVRKGGEQEREELARAVMEFVEVWAEGAKVNEPKGGEEFRLLVRKELVEGGGVGKQMVERLEGLAREAKTRRDWEEVGRVAGSVEGLVKLVAISSDSEEELLPKAALVKVFDTLLKAGVWDEVASEIYPLTRPRSLPRPSNSYLHLRPITSLLATILDFPSTDLTPKERLSKSLELLLILLPGDESLAKTIVQSIFALDFEALFSSLGLSSFLKGLTHRHGLAILEPFFYFLFSPQEDGHVAPLSPSPSSLPLVSTLRLPSTSNLPLISPSASLEHHRSLRGLPLRRTWLFQPITELLHSSSSQAFASAPPDWDASETELVQATLAFSSVVQAISENGRARMGASEMILELMGVFLLEKGVPTVVEGGPDGRSQDTSGSEVFRDPLVNQLMTFLLKPFLASSSSSQSANSNNTPSTLDQAYSLSSPRSRTPFFQPYTDFLALYTSISFSHPLFALLLLPPLASSTTYAPDYRKLFWAEENLPLLRGITVSARNVLVESSEEGLKAFLWPREKDQDLLGGYLRAVVGGSVTRERNEFLYWVAVHHLAMAIWQDEEGGKTAKSLMLVVLGKGREEVVRDLMRYEQREGEKVRLSEGGCFSGEGVDLKERKERVKGWAGERGVKRLEGLGL